MAGQVDLRGELAAGRHALSMGRVPEIAELVRSQPKRVGRLMELLWDDDGGVANRAADVMERISRDPSPALWRRLVAFKEALLGLLTEARFIKVRWNLALLIARFPLTVGEARRAAAALETYLDDRSSIVKTAALQGLADLTRHDSASLPSVLDILRIQGRSGTPAMRARSRHLLKRLEGPAGSSKRESRTAMERVG
ncbi:MAG TPA: hypothetical protein VGG85_12915 [Terracidiphilus sp.]|jgi:hypothetical protein